MLQGESNAKQQYLAFWSQANPVIPWNYRHRNVQKTTSQPIQPQQQNNCDPSYPDLLPDEKFTRFELPRHHPKKV
ncbi:hypothetical protein [uncultured Nostoc sp.]|uniref:hypothetical protein n=1 Tax=uncultured Nostoc sp. TaxID=340711 RepID=UPI0035C9A4F0